MFYCKSFLQALLQHAKKNILTDYAKQSGHGNLSLSLSLYHTHTHTHTHALTSCLIYFLLFLISLSFSLSLSHIHNLSFFKKISHHAFNIQMLFTNDTPVSSLNCITKILRHQDKTIVWEKIDATSEKKTTHMGKCPQNVQVLSSKESYSKSSSILLKYNWLKLWCPKS